MNQSKIRKIIFNLVTGKIEKYELILIALIIGVLALNTVDAKIVEIVTTLVLSSAGILYIMTAYKDTSDSNFTQVDEFFSKISGFSSAVAVVGVLFSLQNFPGYKNMLIVGGLSLVIVLGYILVKQQVKKMGMWATLRIFILAVITAVVYFEQVIGN